MCRMCICHYTRAHLHFRNLGFLFMFAAGNVVSRQARFFFREWKGDLLIINISIFFSPFLKYMQAEGIF